MKQQVARTQSNLLKFNLTGSVRLFLRRVIIQIAIVKDQVPRFQFKMSLFWRSLRTITINDYKRRMVVQNESLLHRIVFGDGYLFYGARIVSQIVIFP